MDEPLYPLPALGRYRSAVDPQRVVEVTDAWGDDVDHMDSFGENFHVIVDGRAARVEMQRRDWEALVKEHQLEHVAS